MSVRQQPLPIFYGANTNKPFSVKDLCFCPLRFCGRQWMWVKNDSNGQISQIALKALATPFLAGATFLAGLPAVVGALVFSAGNRASFTQYGPGCKMNLLRRDISNEEVARQVQGFLHDSHYSVEVQSVERDVSNGYYAGYIHRKITITNPSSTKITRFLELIKTHFYNKESPPLNSLYSCIYGRNAEECLSQLKQVLALHQSVTFSMAFDLAYVTISCV